ncbi:MAG: PIN domain nuclease [Candidatus Kapabacteria bacterium]|nr:PIN domain nuclease [Ignavibacteriota bacterium]MCW5883421.1 PIN domain nuclease [Candidatus Kapabacteria bacterium]
MNIVLDTNILFSAILNTNSKFAQILLTDNNNHRILAPDYINEEILSHQYKILTLKGYTETEFNKIFQLLTANIELIHHKDIPIEYLNRAIEICTDIDIDDTYFVATALFCDAKLWTGDKKLISGLLNKGINIHITTSELYKIFFNDNE